MVKPAWSSLPNGADFIRFYPRHALAQRREGMAIMKCHVDLSGALSGCVILRETPLGSGFGAATLRMAPLFQMKPMSVDGRPVAGGIVKIPVQFKVARRDSGRT